MRQRSCRLGLALAVAACGACRGEPGAAVAVTEPVAAVSASSVAKSPPPAPPANSAPASAPAAAPSATTAGSGSLPGVAVDDASLAVPLVAADGSALPQTEERPSSSSPRFTQRLQALARAILAGAPELAHDSFFPLVAYAQVKDVAKPERDYRFRLLANFERDVRDYRKALGRDAGQAEFLGVDVPEEKIQWMKPGSEGNRVGYFRVLRSKLRFRMPAGPERVLELTSMISWRGEWYVVHLHGFK